MASKPPLQLVIFRHQTDVDTLPYEEAILRAFQGGKEAGGYLATGEDLGIQIELFSAAPPTNAQEVLDSFCHTLVVVLLDAELLADGTGAHWNWLADCWQHVQLSNGQHALQIVPMDGRISVRLSAHLSALSGIQFLQVHTLGERAGRPANLALRLLHECRLLLAKAVSTPGASKAEYLRIFISHAKIDGLPLAHALKHQISSLGWLQKFYDADDIPPGSDWQKELEKGVGSSLIVMLRSDIYDSRHWCQREVLWADEFATPAVLVDARTGLDHPANSLPYDRIPTARIPDGNLFRILFLALREGLRFLYFARRVEQMKIDGAIPSPVKLRVFSFAPGMAALLRACHSLNAEKASASTPSIILYPDLPLRAGQFEAAQALVAAYSPGTRLVTPYTLAATGGVP